jgi:hypothetical protein
MDLNPVPLGQKSGALTTELPEQSGIMDSPNLLQIFIIFIVKLEQVVSASIRSRSEEAYIWES